MQQYASEVWYVATAAQHTKVKDNKFVIRARYWKHCNAELKRQHGSRQCPDVMK